MSFSESGFVAYTSLLHRSWDSRKALTFELPLGSFRSQTSEQGSVLQAGTLAHSSVHGAPTPPLQSAQLNRDQGPGECRRRLPRGVVELFNLQPMPAGEKDDLTLVLSGAVPCCRGWWCLYQLYIVGDRWDCLAAVPALLVVRG